MLKTFLLSLFLFASAFAGCPFCNQEVIDRQLVHNSDSVMVLYCLTPTTKGNLLIVPKRHLERFEDLSQEEFLEIQTEINRLSVVFRDLYGISDYVILMKNGKQAGQSVAHIHFHMIPAPKSFDEIIDTAFHHRDRISNEEMKTRTEELREFLCSKPS